jgi:hypothetical protein
MREALAIGLIISGLLLIAVSALYTGRSSKGTALGLIACGTGCMTVASAMMDNLLGGVLNAGVTAFALYHWWNNGGGDGTRRRVRRWARTFQGVRRTAPVGGTA